MSPFKLVCLTSNRFDIMENALYNVHSFRIITIFKTLFRVSLFPHNSAGRHRLTKSVVFVATLISSESLKLDMSKLFNLH